jgi:hypothetical protein
LVYVLNTKEQEIKSVVKPAKNMMLYNINLPFTPQLLKVIHFIIEIFVESPPSTVQDAF